MERVKVLSSMIESIAWDKNTLTVEFKGGKVFEYQDVPQPTWEQFFRSDSKGKFFHSQIKNKFDFREVKCPA